MHAFSAAIGGAFSKQGDTKNPFMIMQDELIEIINAGSAAPSSDRVSKSQLRANRAAVAAAIQNMGGKKL